MSLADDAITALAALDLADVYRDDQVPEGAALPLIVLADYSADDPLLRGDDVTLARERTLLVYLHRLGGFDTTEDDTETQSVMAALDQVSLGPFVGRVESVVRDFDPEGQIITHTLTVRAAYRP